MADRAFYHSFPRPRGDQDQLAKGLRIVESICRNGLLFVPEEVTWLDPTGTRPGDRIRALQRRICFTELTFEELPQHAETFGPFAIEYPIGELRRLGTLPVVYVPDSIDTGSLECIGTSILARLTDASQVIRALAHLEELTAETIETDITTRDGKVYRRNFDATESRTIREYVAFLRSGPKQQFSEISGALLAYGSLFYPVENLQYTGVLGYYRQREWRMISGPVIHGKPTSQVANETQQEELLRIDHEFFSRLIPFADGNHTLAQKSHFMSALGGAHVLSFASRIIVPERVARDVEDLLRSNAIGVRVVSR